MNVNLRGTVLVTKALLPLLKVDGGQSSISPRTAACVVGATLWSTMQARRV